VTPFNEDDVASEVVSIGLWTDITVRLLKLPTLEEIAKEPLGGGQFQEIADIQSYGLFTRPILLSHASCTRTRECLNHSM